MTYYLTMDPLSISPCCHLWQPSTLHFLCYEHYSPLFTNTKFLWPLAFDDVVIYIHETLILSISCTNDYYFPLTSYLIWNIIWLFYPLSIRCCSYVNMKHSYSSCPVLLICIKKYVFIDYAIHRAFNVIVIHKNL